MKAHGHDRGALTVVKVGLSRQVVIPKRFGERLGLAPGDYLKVELRKNHLVLTPRARVEKGLAESLEDFRKGRVYGPFDSAEELVNSLHNNARRVRLKTSKGSPR